jgi:WD40 repeat protein
MAENLRILVPDLSIHPTLPILAIFNRGNNVYYLRYRYNSDNSDVDLSERFIFTLQGHVDFVVSVAFHPTLPILATGSEDNTAKLWRFNPDYSSASCVATLEEHGSYVNSVAFHPTLNILATGSRDNTAKLWSFNPDGTAASCIVTLQGHSDRVISVMFHPTLNILATGSGDNTAKLWRFNRANGSAASCVATLQGHTKYVYSVAFHLTFPILVTGSGDNTAKLWHLNSDGTAASCIATLQEHSDAVSSVAFHPFLPILATSSYDNTIKFWRFNTANNSTVSCVATVQEDEDNRREKYTSVVFHRLLPILISIDFRGRLFFWYLNEEGIVENSAPIPDAPEDALSIRNGVFGGGPGKIITIPLELRRALQSTSKNNSINEKYHNFKHLYDQIMDIDLTVRFKFEFQGETVEDACGLRRMVFDVIFDLYKDLYFKSIDENNFIILKEKLEITKLNDHTEKIILLAIAAKSLVFLKFNPKLLDLLSVNNSTDLKKYFNNTKRNNFLGLYEFFEKSVNKLTGEEKDPGIFGLKMDGQTLNNVDLNGYFININNSEYFKNNNSKRTLLLNGQFEQLENSIKREIRLRRFAVDCGFTTWEQLTNMYNFIKKFWKNEIFTNELKFDLVSFKKRIIIKKSDTQEILNLDNIPPIDNIPPNLLEIYPALRPLLDYIIGPESKDINRMKFVRYVTGTKYSPSVITILLVRSEIDFNTINGTKIYKLPFLAHTCFSILDLFKLPRTGNYQETYNVKKINEEITKGSGLAGKN